ncbi:MAG: DUF1152 domain-containing protein [Polyangiaceae bacterium]
MTSPSAPVAEPSTLFIPAFWRALSGAERVLVAGAGGGFDVFAALPIYLQLRALGKTAFLANLSFSDLAASDAERLSPSLFRIDHLVGVDRTYFPERHLAGWLASNGMPGDVYAFDPTGVQPLRSDYALLVERLGVDTIVLVDGGTDMLMRGDEVGLGTPVEDMMSLGAVSGLPVKSFVACIGFGVDAYHGVCHAHFLENVAALEAEGAFLGAHTIHLASSVVAQFVAAVEYAHSRMPYRQSIVNSSIQSALEGRFGDVHRSLRTARSTLFINPLMTLYWYFDLGAVARRSLYLSTLEATNTPAEIEERIAEFRRSLKAVRPKAAIPV